MKSGNTFKPNILLVNCQHESCTLNTVLIKLCSKYIFEQYVDNRECFCHNCYSLLLQFENIYNFVTTTVVF